MLLQELRSAPAVVLQGVLGYFQVKLIKGAT